MKTKNLVANPEKLIKTLSEKFSVKISYNLTVLSLQMYGNI